MPSLLKKAVLRLKRLIYLMLPPIVYEFLKKILFYSIKKINLTRRDKSIQRVAMFLVGGFGDIVIFAKVVEQLRDRFACEIEVYSEPYAHEYLGAIFYKWPRIKICDKNKCRYYHFLTVKYDVSMTLSHSIRIDFVNNSRLRKYCPELLEAVTLINKHNDNMALSSMWDYAMIFKRNEVLGLNRYTEFNYGGVFRCDDKKVNIYLDDTYRVHFLGLGLAKYITVNTGSGSDSNISSKLHAKKWPVYRYEEYIALIKKKYPDIMVVQVGVSSDLKIKGVDRYIIDGHLEILKWVLKNSMLHTDCESGLVFLATQMGTKCAALFGPSPMWMFAYEQNININSGECPWCQNARHDALRVCIRGLEKPICMDSITGAMVAEAVDSVLNLQT